MGQDNGLVFINSKGTPLEALNAVNRSFKPLLKQVGYPIYAGTIFAKQEGPGAEVITSTRERVPSPGRYLEEKGPEVGR